VEAAATSASRRQDQPILPSPQITAPHRGTLRTTATRVPRSRPAQSSRSLSLTYEQSAPAAPTLSVSLEHAGMVIRMSRAVSTRGRPGETQARSARPSGPRTHNPYVPVVGDSDPAVGRGDPLRPSSPERAAGRSQHASGTTRFQSKPELQGSS